ncbi:MAG: hypothetical protein C0391_03490 [Anaerolinea sp.]|nr:hypothetical protein [Anaerolinea sp.]
MSKKEEIRKKRESQKRKNKLLIVMGIAVFVLLVTAAVVLPFLKANARPVGEIIVPDSRPRPNADGMAMGDPNASIVLEEYSDFQCKYCKIFADDSEQSIVEDFVSTGKIYFVYKPFTVIGSESDAAALAAYCAADQNKFWEYHDILFANITGAQVGDFLDNRLYAFAEKVGLNMDDFKSCYNSQNFLGQLNADRAAGVAARLEGTPAFFVNGVNVSLGDLYSTLAEMVNQ